MNKSKSDFMQLFERDLLEFLTKNDGEGLRILYRLKLTRKARKQLEQISQHFKLKPFVVN